MAGTIITDVDGQPATELVSMESGLDGRNNRQVIESFNACPLRVSMESGLDGRNNMSKCTLPKPNTVGLNGVRPRWPEQ